MLNLQLCAAVLFSGCNPTATLRMLASIGVPVASNRTFFAIQRSYLWPAIGRVRSHCEEVSSFLCMVKVQCALFCFQVWKEEQKSLLQELQGQQVNLAGDGRADSPGFSAKYGTYTLMDVERHKVLHFEVVQSNDAGGSCRMELEGLKQGLAFLESESIKVAVLVTDRHTQIKCFLRNNKAAIAHELDVWHMAKGITKKLHTAAKQNNCKELAPWIKSVCNHLYWAAASSEGKAELIVPKWLSLLNHIRDIHTQDQASFPTCLHGDIEPKQWLREESKAFQKLQDNANSKALLQDMPRLSTRHQTYGLEAFHSLLVHFAPMTYHY
ncbi:uncharacterized protein LOC144094158 [Amblyomma americanum]